MTQDDDRIEVLSAPAAQAGPGDVVVRVGVPGHLAGCACCRPRDHVALALARLFVERARDPSLTFRRVLVDPADAGPDAVARAIAGDVLARARFRFVGSA